MSLTSKSTVTQGFRITVQEGDVILDTGVKAPAGAIVTINSSGKVALATSPDLSAADPILWWYVYRGTDEPSVSNIKSPSILRGDFMAITDQLADSHGFTAGTAPGTPVSFNGGGVKVASSNEQVIGYLRRVIVEGGTVVAVEVDFVSVGFAKK